MGDEPIGETLARRYRVIEILGRGGMGTVYKALDTRLQRVVALKVLRSGFAPDAQSKQRFLREAGTLARLNHPNILQIYDVGEAEGLLYLAVEYIEGCSLGQMMAEGKLLDPEYAIEIIRQVGTALRYAHKRGVIHRDVKPSNIFISNQGRVLLLDFGLATAPGVPTRTETGTIAGTPAYMSPEQAMGKPVDARSDLFSLGVVFYELLAGGRPFSGASPGEILRNVVEQTPASPRLFHCVSASVEQIVLKSLAKDPDQRFQTSNEFLSALGEATPRPHPQDATAIVPRSGSEIIAPERPRPVDRTVRVGDEASLLDQIVEAGRFAPAAKPPLALEGRGPRLLWVAVGVTVLLLGGVVFFRSFNPSRVSKNAAPPPSLPEKPATPILPPSPSAQGPTNTQALNPRELSRARGAPPLQLKGQPAAQNEHVESEESTRFDENVRPFPGGQPAAPATPPIAAGPSPPQPERPAATVPPQVEAGQGDAGKQVASHPPLVPSPGFLVWLMLAVLTSASALVFWFLLRPRLAKAKAAIPELVRSPVAFPAPPPFDLGASGDELPRPANQPRTDGQAGKAADRELTETGLMPYTPAAAIKSLRHDPSAIAWLLVLDGPQRGREFRLGDDVTIGRHSDSDVMVPDTRVSRRHARISLENGRYYVSDFQSRHGTFVNGVRVQKRELRDRDEISFGLSESLLLFIQAVGPADLTIEAKRRLREFDAIWDQLTSSARHD